MQLQEEQRHGRELDAHLKALAGMKNNNPKDWPGVSYIKLQPRYVPKRNAEIMRAKSERPCACLQTLAFLGWCSCGCTICSGPVVCAAIAAGNTCSGQCCKRILAFMRLLIPGLW